MGLAEYIAEKYGKDMATMLFPNQTPFYVVTNKSEYRGASAILNKKMLSEFGRKYNINKVVVIPSSIHDFPDPGTAARSRWQEERPGRKA